MSLFLGMHHMLYWWLCMWMLLCVDGKSYLFLPQQEAYLYFILHSATQTWANLLQLVGGACQGTTIMNWQHSSGTRPLSDMFTALSLLVQVYGPDMWANQGLQGKDKYDILNSQYQEDDAKIVDHMKNSTSERCIKHAENLLAEHFYKELIGTHHHQHSRIFI
jgi:hypothetical protein